MANSLSIIFGAIVFFLLVLIASLAWQRFDSCRARD